METRGNGASLQVVSADPSRVRERTRGRLIERGLDPDRVIQAREADLAIDVVTFYELLGTMAASEKAGQSPTYSLARLALRSGLPSEVADTLFLAFNQQSAEEAGHGDKVFGNAYFSMGGVPPGGENSVFGDGSDVSSGLQPRDDPRENERLLRSTAATIGGIETAALQRLFPFVTTVCEHWDHPIARDLAKQIRDVVRPEESRHVLIWRYVFHQLAAPRGPSSFPEYIHATNAGRRQLAAPAFDRESLERMLGTGAPTPRQLLGKDRTLQS
jgi:hypothetical protein